ncbi:uncharacterized protein TM35_001411000, partial [Trypanosoma theileri]
LLFVSSGGSVVVVVVVVVVASVFPATASWLLGASPPAGSALLTSFAVFEPTVFSTDEVLEGVLPVFWGVGAEGSSDCEPPAVSSLDGVVLLTLVWETDVSAFLLSPAGGRCSTLAVFLKCSSC